MAHTKRIYNRLGYLFWHEFKQHPGYHCRIALRRKRKDEIEGLLRGLDDFISDRYAHFKNDEELEEYLMNL